MEKELESDLQDSCELLEADEFKWIQRKALEDIRQCLSNLDDTFI